MPAAPLGQSDDANSPHFDDQAIQLVSNRKMESTYFKDKVTLLKNLESKEELIYRKSVYAGVARIDDFESGRVKDR